MSSCCFNLDLLNLEVIDSGDNVIIYQSWESNRSDYVKCVSMHGKETRALYDMIYDDMTGSIQVDIMSIYFHNSNRAPIQLSISWEDAIEQKSAAAGSEDLQCQPAETREKGE